MIRPLRWLFCTLVSGHTLDLHWFARDNHYLECKECHYRYRAPSKNQQEMQTVTRHSELTELVGRTITGILIDDNGEYLTFETDAGPVHFEGEGDCCSHTYFAELLGVANMLTGRPVAAVETMDLDDAPESTDYALIQCYGHKLRFGPEPEWCGENSAMVIYRNSSNGYYGGWLNWVTTVPEGAKMTRVTTDYQAE